MILSHNNEHCLGFLSWWQISVLRLYRILFLCNIWLNHMEYWLTMVEISEPDPLSCSHVLKYLHGGNNVTACTRPMLIKEKQRKHALSFIHCTGGYSSIGHRVSNILTNEVSCHTIIQAKTMVICPSHDISVREFTK
jgi:hypothetical protein